MSFKALIISSIVGNIFHVQYLYLVWGLFNTKPWMVYFWRFSISVTLYLLDCLFVALEFLVSYSHLRGHALPLVGAIPEALQLLGLLMPSSVLSHIAWVSINYSSLYQWSSVQQPNSLTIQISSVLLRSLPSHWYVPINPHDSRIRNLSTTMAITPISHGSSAFQLYGLLAPTKGVTNGFEGMCYTFSNINGQDKPVTRSWVKVSGLPKFE